jgi:hypothetical protein
MWSMSPMLRCLTSFVCATIATVLLPCELAAQDILSQFRANTVSPAADKSFAGLRDSAGNLYLFWNSAGYITGCKTDSSGTELWRKQYANKANSSHVGMAAEFDSAGSIVVAGHELSILAASPGRMKASILKIKPSDGSLQYSTLLTVDAQADMFTRDLATDKLKNSIVLLAENIVVKLSSTGLPLWSNTLADAAYNTVIADGEGNVYVTGMLVSSSDAIVRKFSPDGTLLWSYVLVDSTNTVGSVVRFGADGSAYMIGTASQRTALGNDSDWLTIKLNPSTGAVVWKSIKSSTSMTLAESVCGGFIDAVTGDVVIGGGTDNGVSTVLRLSSADGAQTLLTKIPKNYAEAQSSTDILSDGNGGAILGMNVRQGVSNWNMRAASVSSAGSILWTSDYDGHLASPDILKGLIVEATANRVTLFGTSEEGLWELHNGRSVVLSLTTGEIVKNVGFSTIRSNTERGDVSVQTPDGGWVVLGYRYSEQAQTHPFVARFEKDGTPRWTTAFESYSTGASFSRFFTALKVAKDGSVIIAGEDDGKITLVRMDRMTGVIRWTRTHQNPSGLEIYLGDVAPDKLGDVFVVGAERTYESYNDLFVWKVDASTGSEEWYRKYDSESDAQVWTAICDIGNELVVGGSLGTNNLRRPMIARIDNETGDPFWYKDYDSEVNARGFVQKLALVPDGSVLATGQPPKAVGYGTAPTNLSKISMIDGSVTWSSLAGPLEHFVIERSQALIGVASYGYDCHLVKVRLTDGVVLWAVDYDNPDNSDEDFARCITLGPSGNAIISGSSIRHTASGDRVKMFTATFSGLTGARRWFKLYPEAPNLLGAPCGLGVNAEEQSIWVGSDLFFGFEAGNGDLVVSTLSVPAFTRTINGTATLSPFVGPRSQVKITATVRKAGTTGGIGKQAMADSTGAYSFSFDLRDDKYEILIKPSHWLRKKFSSLLVDATTLALGTKAFINGDANGDNTIGEADRQAVTAALGSTPTSGNWNAEADLNGNSVVDQADLDIVNQNFGKSGQ